MTSQRVLERQGCHGFDSPLNVAEGTPVEMS